MYVFHFAPGVAMPLHAQTRTRTYTLLYTRTNTLLYTRTNTLLYTRTNTHTHIHSHTHTLTLLQTLLYSLFHSGNRVMTWMSLCHFLSSFLAASLTMLGQFGWAANSMSHSDVM